jgi:hypothetical protein
LPSKPAEQKKIAAETERLACLYGQKLAALEALKKSLQHQAFTEKRGRYLAQAKFDHRRHGLTDS